MNWRLGALPVGDGRTSFSVWAPQAKRVDVRLLSTGERIALTDPPSGTASCAEGTFGRLVECEPGTRYRYILDDSLERPDPASASQPEGIHGPSEVVDLTAYGWHDDAFRPVPLRDAVLYELHVGTFTPGQTFAAAVAVLDDLVELGVTAVELMPVAQFPGARNWGYDGVFPFAVQNSYGGPLGMQRFVDECHQRGLAVILDVVYNHFGPEGNVLPDFGPYLTERYRTPWGPAVNLDGPGCDGVRRYLTANALQWFEDFHVDGLRLDAVHEIVDRSATPFLAELAEAARDSSERSGRPAWLIAESADNNPLVVSPRELGGLGLRAQWNDDFHHALHRVLTGEESGYYRDYHGSDDVARAMDQGFVYQGQYSAFRGHRHGAPSVGLDPSRFVVFAQNHDQVGNRADGARLASLVAPELLRLAAAILLLAPGIPLLFMGEEYGETAPFAYFVDHGDPDLLDAVRRGRAREHERPDVDVLDPGDEETFGRSILDPARRRGDQALPGLMDLYRDLIAVRAAEPALRRAGRSATTACAHGPVVTLTRSHRGTTLMSFFNLSPSDAVGALPGLGDDTAWEELLEPGPRSQTGVPLEPWGFRVFRTALETVAP